MQGQSVHEPYRACEKLAGKISVPLLSRRRSCPCNYPSASIVPCGFCNYCDYCASDTLSSAVFQMTFSSRTSRALWGPFWEVALDKSMKGPKSVLPNADISCSPSSDCLQVSAVHVPLLSWCICWYMCIMACGNSNCSASQRCCMQVLHARQARFIRSCTCMYVGIM